MKTARKVLVLALCAVLLVSATIMGTMAYLTSQDTVTNTFTVGKVAITLDETDVDNSTNGQTRDQANEYHLLPGHEYTKDPIIHVAATSEDCYLFVKVVNEISAIETTVQGATVADQMAAEGWKLVDGQTNIYVYANGTDAKTAVSAGTDVTVFEKFAIDGNKVVNVPEGETVPTGKLDIAAYTGKTITVTAYAVQKDGFEAKTPVEIWAAAGLS